MWHRLFLGLLTAIAIALAGVGAGMPLGHAATTTAAVANYDYDHLSTFAQSADTSTVGVAGFQHGFGPSRAVARVVVAAEEGTAICRAVGPDELADLQNLGRYRVPPGGTEGKYFFETPEQASNFARMMGDTPYTTTSVRVSPAELAKGDPINPAREGPGYFFRTPDVPSGSVTIFNHSVLP